MAWIVHNGQTPRAGNLLSRADPLLVAGAPERARLQMADTDASATGHDRRRRGEVSPKMNP